MVQHGIKSMVEENRQTYSEFELLVLRALFDGVQRNGAWNKENTGESLNGDYCGRQSEAD